ANRTFSDTLDAVLDSAATAGVPIARITTTLSVALTQDGAVRLAQVRGVEGPYPFYGEIVTSPAGMWPRIDEGRSAFVELALLEQLGAQVGDSIRLGNVWFDVAAALTALPPEFSFRNAIGPRVYIAARHLPDMGVIRFGSIARYEAYLRIPDDEELQRFVDLNHDMFRRGGFDFDTAAEQAENLGEALEALGRFLGLVGLCALLLGGLGVASAVHVFVKDKRRTVAVLRCLGATQRTAFGAYLLQATVLGTLGAIAGALLGVGIQAALPAVIGDVLPITVPFSVQWGVVGIGVAIGTVVAAAFALLPLLAVRGIPPLRALRHDVDDVVRRVDPWRIAAFTVIVLCVLLVAVWQARLWQVGLAYAGALTVGLGVLWCAAALLVMMTRRTARRGFAALRAGRGGTTRRRSFALRQGIANLYRPRNQTTSVTMALGFGVFLVATLWIVQQNLLGWMQTDASRPQPNLVFFDIQADQSDSVRALMRAGGAGAPDLVPIVPARITAVRGITIDSLMSQSPRTAQPWAVRREYRHTWRDTMTTTETLLEGEWFDSAAPAPEGVARVSIERDVARDLGVSVGDRVTWDVTGFPVESIVTSVREVEWARFETNFFFVFESGVLESAPQTIVSLVSVENDTARAALQRNVVTRYPNISVVDLASVQRILQRIVDRIIFAIRFMAGFSVAAGALVLFGAVAASRFQRVRESALLRALGATHRQIRNILLVEYAALGALAGLTGTALAALAGWLIMRFVFEMEFELPLVELVSVWLGVTAAAAILGMLNSREALRSTPLAALREAES
ncbi:MAG TPA: FtsX-like permease family protein, partial [Longimicrobiales bacterium]|nr:FtsX-like permease family protein [Longimicrobiales bacterium]